MPLWSKNLDDFRLREGPPFNAESFSKAKSCQLLTCSGIHALPLKNYKSKEWQHGTDSMTFSARKKKSWLLVRTGQIRLRRQTERQPFQIATLV